MTRALFLSILACAGLSLANASEKGRISVVGQNGMPKEIVQPGSIWNFGSGALQSHKGWQYAAYWDDACQVSVACRPLPDGAWSVVSLPGYQRSATGDRGTGGPISKGFGDGHEKVAMGISPDGVIHLSFDQHLSTLRYRASKQPVADNPAAHAWSAALFGPVMDNLGGPKLESVTYPSFTSDGTRFALYLRMDGGSGSASSNFFEYEGGRWRINDEPSSKLIDKRWSGGNKTVNAYPHGLAIHNGRRHMTWCWRDTPDASTCHDLCYAYSDDHGKTWKNNDGRVVATTGADFITADSPGIAVWKIPPGTAYINGGSMTVDDAGRVHVLVRGEKGTPVYFKRDPASGTWTRQDTDVSGALVAGPGDTLYVVSDSAVKRTSASNFGATETVAVVDRSLFRDSKMGVDKTRVRTEGWISMIGQDGQTIRVVDYKIGPGSAPAP